MSHNEPGGLPPGYEIAGLRVIRFLASGGFANTYLCEMINQHGLQQLCVLKELYPMDIVRRRGPYFEILKDNDARADEIWNASVENFTYEVRALQLLNINNIPKFLDVFVANNTYYLVQEYIEGISLYDYRLGLESEPLKIGTTIQLLKDLLLTLRAIHHSGLLHRDIKPDNIIIRAIDNNPVIIDFGGVRFEVGGVSYNFYRRIGSGYSSPEQTSETLEQSQPSDLYALAASFYFLLFGEAPPDSNDRLLGKPEKGFMLFADIWPAYFLESLQRAFLLSSKARFQSADEWLLALEQDDESLTPLKIWRVGRDPEQVDILLPNCSDTVSRVHLEIHLYDDGVWLIDCSTNGITVIKNHGCGQGGVTDFIDKIERHEIDGKYFLSKDEWFVDERFVTLDLAGNMYLLSDLIDLKDN